MDYLPVDLRSGLKKIQNTVLQRSPIEIKVREATSNDPWGAATTLKAEIAQATRNFEDYKVVMSTIWTRLQDSGKHFRHVLKGLQLLEYLIGNGSERVIDECKESIYTIRTLRNFQYIDEKGKDQGNAVREAAKALIKLLGDEKSIAESRQTAKKMKKNMVGISSSESGFRRGGNSSYDDDDERESKYDNYSSKAPKAAPKNEDDDDEEQVKPQKRTQKPAPVFEEEDEEDGGFQVRKTYTPAETKKPMARPPSAEMQPVRTAPAPQAKPKQQTVGELLSIDSFMTPDPFASTQPQQTFVNPRQVQPQPSWETNDQEGFGGDSFGNESFEADFHTAPAAQEGTMQHDSIMDLAAGLVNLDLKEKNTAPASSPQTGSQQPAQAKSILERQKEKGSRPTPKLAPAPTAVGAVPGAPGARPTFPQQPYPGTYSPQQTPGYPQPYPGARPPQQPYPGAPGAYPPQQGGYPPNNYNPFGAPAGARPGYPYQ